MIENQSQETQGITEKSMEKQLLEKEAIQRLTPSAETSNPGCVGE